MKKELRKWAKEKRATLDVATTTIDGGEIMPASTAVFPNARAPIIERAIAKLFGICKLASVIISNKNKTTKISKSGGTDKPSILESIDIKKFIGKMR